MPVDAPTPNEKTIAPLTAARSFVENLRKPSHILVAISGGSDSTGLLLALQETMAEMDRAGLRLSAVTVDHALRAESTDEARKVAMLCAELGIPHVTRRWDGAKPVSGLSEASRLARYRLIADVARETGADLVATGHTVGDQRETVAMRAARSSGSDNPGLSGMADAVLYDGRHWIMRPFLMCERQAIRDYLSSRSRGWFDDPSNENTRYERVRVRQALPVSPVRIDAETSLKRQALSKTTAAFLREHAQVFHAALARLAGDGVNPDLPEFRQGLAALVATLGGRAFFPAAGSMERVLRFLKTAENGRLTVGRVLLDRRRDGLYMVREQRNLPELHIGAHEQGLWDDRFLVKNESAFPAHVKAHGVSGAAEAAALFPSVPAGVAKPAMAGLPQIAAVADGSVSLAETVTVIPRLAPFDLFLPRFDLELANAIANLFGRAAYPQPPV
ncbi:MULTISPECIES: tRNA lysidine(34) synthetase TilS [unclassified Agrobacterium]|uniref:tRNA lysidine(34) synthetase TilS n=1 Tax=unclassified Agrobacterium TaxID=2632611 RepID=UPI002448114A|nr:MULTISPECIES: tRNA lysidine(34) synthetase TilS [unclassified Agrobacterium]MDH0612083.1 tRNA lysidine(34) synthetase TilS [Agrobacterium sp. GD03872]MDH0695980.1 tRNA lysidine(34) synthetase TilS [Agrobacterium sp. GD03871]MDH1058746.1 tRNA lysidine(34) synthetase TilS [Agrobacterium sp. GD03992]MDH2210837.1 tRNA lysidine(34) synthetase TilS [Agrobacterium sp. GD03643]MDH2217746.1 tRNA lysidine(34) synthetase TilS [Agrobacterium sp. GD03638]